MEEVLLLHRDFAQKHSTNVFCHDVVSFAEERLIFPEQPIILLLLVALYFLVVSIMNTWFGSLA